MISYRLTAADLDLWPMRVKTMETAMMAYFFPLTFSLCVIFQETLPEMALTNFSLNEKANTVDNNKQRK